LINLIEYLITILTAITLIIALSSKGRNGVVRIINYFTGYVRMEKISEDSDIKKLNNLVKDIDEDRKEIKEEFKNIKNEFKSVKSKININREVAAKGYVSGLKRDIVNNFDYWRMMENQLREEGLTEQRINQAKQRVKDEISILYGEYEKYGGNYNISHRVKNFLDDKEEY